MALDIEGAVLDRHPRGVVWVNGRQACDKQGEQRNSTNSGVLRNGSDGNRFCVLPCSAYVQILFCFEKIEAIVAPHARTAE